MDASTFQHGTHWATSDNAGTWCCWSQHNDTGRFFTGHWVRDRVLDTRDAEETLLCLFDSLGNGLWNFFSLAVADTDVSIAISNNYKSCEGEATAAFDDLCYTIDRNYAFNIWRFFNWRLAVFATATSFSAGTFSAGATLLPCCCSSHWVSFPSFS
jgi:hypothetical protein